MSASVQHPVAPFDWAARGAILAVLKRTASANEARKEAKRLIDQAEEALPKTTARDRESIANAALYAGYVVAGFGDSREAKRALAVTQAVIAQAPQPVLANLAAIVRARIELQAGNARHALAQLAPYDQPTALALTGLERLDAHRVLDSGVAQLPKLQASPKWRGRAYMEWAAERPPVIELLTPR